MLKSVFDHPYRSDVCFICATPLNDTNQTEEHVFPKWLQERFNLWNQHLILLNDTDIKYKQLTIPCCFKCNNTQLSPLEKRISEATEKGFDAIKKIPRFDIFKWMAKIFLGMQYKELSLSINRRKPEYGNIITPEIIQHYTILHFWLQMNYSKNDPKFSPGSLWIFQCQEPKLIEHRFDLKDDATNGVLAIRLGKVAIVADFLENGVHQEINSEKTKKVSQFPLHPMQFDELTAITIYEAGLLGQKTEISFFENEDGSTTYAVEWWSTVKGNSAMRPWNPSDYAKVLSFYTGLPYEFVYQPPGKLRTWLHDPDQNLVYWEIGKPHPFAEKNT